MPLEFVDIHIQPDRFAEIKFIADLIQSIENLVGSCIVTVITDGGIFDHMIVFKFYDMMCYIDTKVYERKRIILNNME